MTGLDEKIAALVAKQGLKSATPVQRPKKVASKKKSDTRKTVKKVATAPKKADEQDELFAHAYIRHGCNATKAYLEVFPNVKHESASVLGWKRLRKVNVQRILFPMLERLMEKNEVDTQFVISRLLEQADASPLDYFAIREDGGPGSLDLSAITPAQRRNLKSIRYKRTVRMNDDGEETVTEDYHVTVVDQQKAVEMFAKYLQMFTKELEPEDADRIGDLIEMGVKRIRANKDLNAWRDVAVKGHFNDGSQ